MERLLEPEVMDTTQESIAYDAMDFREVNMAFALEAIAFGPPQQGIILDAGTGPGRIPVLISKIRPKWQIIAIDAAQSMLDIATQHVKEALKQSSIRLELIDAKNLPYEDGQFDLIISNSLIHHLPEPLPFFQELKRVLKPNGGIFIRDLFRPADEATMNDLVDSIGGEYDDCQTKLFRDSLHAALTLDEVNQLISQVNLTQVKVYHSSDRHWTAERRWSAES